MQSISQTPSVYAIRHLESDRVYIGSARNPRRRCSVHLHSLRKGTHHSCYLQRAWNKYGETAFVFEILEPVLFIEDLLSREQYWIDMLHACDSSCGFNIAPTAGSALGVKHTDETRANMKLARSDLSRRAHMSALAKARCSDPEFRAKQHARMADPASRAKQSAGHKRWLAANPDVRAEIAARTKAHVTPDARAKASARSTELWADPKFRAKTERGRSERAKVLWADPEFRAKQAAARAAWHADPEHRTRVVKRRAGRRKTSEE